MTFATKMRSEAQETKRLPWAFGRAMIREELEERLVGGLQAFAQLWFLELSDETQLPEEFHRLVALVERHYLADVGELEDEDEDEEEDQDDADEA